MWTYLAYILNRYREITGKNELAISKLYKFHANTLWLEMKLTFWEGAGDLNSDISYLRKLKLIDVRTEPEDTIEITDPVGLGRVAAVAGKPNIKLFNEYKRRIDKSISIWLKVGKYSDAPVERNLGCYGEVWETLVYTDDIFHIVKRPAKVGFCYEVVPHNEAGGRLDDWEICPEPPMFGEAVSLMESHRQDVVEYLLERGKLRVGGGE